jgi:hypothetical protein
MPFRNFKHGVPNATLQVLDFGEFTQFLLFRTVEESDGKNVQLYSHAGRQLCRESGSGKGMIRPVGCNENAFHYRPLINWSRIAAPNYNRANTAGHR